MNIYILIFISLISAIVFAFAYHPLFSKYARGLLSPYPKADVIKRLRAAMFDGGLVVSACLFYSTTNSILYLLVGAAYLLFRDTINGQSIGKFFFGLVVISLETGCPSSLNMSVRRNLILLIPGANIVAIFLEARSFRHDPQGQRLGDCIAQTQVIEGFGAKDIVKLIQERLMGYFAGDLGRLVGKKKPHTNRNKK